MNLTTLITLAPIFYAVAVTIGLACALERLGWWQQEATHVQKHVRYLERQLERSHKALSEARATLDDDNVIIAWQGKQIDGHLRESVAMMAEVSWWRKGGSVEAELVASEVVGEVESWLLGTR